MRHELSLKARIDQLMAIDAARAKPEHDFSWSLESYQSELTHENSHVFEWSHDSSKANLNGFVISRIVVDGECEIMHLVCALPGRGFEMMQAWLAWAKSQKIKKIFLEFHEQNKSAQKLYSQLGFQEDTRRLNYYRDGGTAILMSKKYH